MLLLVQLRQSPLNSGCLLPLQNHSFSQIFEWLRDEFAVVHL